MPEDPYARLAEELSKSSISAPRFVALRPDSSVPRKMLQFYVVVATRGVNVRIHKLSLGHLLLPNRPEATSQGRDEEKMVASVQDFFSGSLQDVYVDDFLSLHEKCSGLASCLGSSDESLELSLTASLSNQLLDAGAAAMNLGSFEFLQHALSKWAPEFVSPPLRTLDDLSNWHSRWPHFAVPILQGGGPSVLPTASLRFCVALSPMALAVDGQLPFGWFAALCEVLKAAKTEAVKSLQADKATAALIVEGIAHALPGGIAPSLQLARKALESAASDSQKGHGLLIVNADQAWREEEGVYEVETGKQKSLEELVEFYAELAEDGWLTALVNPFREADTQLGAEMLRARRPHLKVVQDYGPDVVPEPAVEEVAFSTGTCEDACVPSKMTGVALVSLGRVAFWSHSPVVPRMKSSSFWQAAVLQHPTLAAFIAGSESNYTHITDISRSGSASAREPSSRCRSFREAKRETREAAGGGEAAPHTLDAVPEDDVLRWSQVAKLAVREAQLEEVRKKQARKMAQNEMKEYLKQQMEHKTSEKQKAVESEHKLHELQQVELERWKRDQTAQAQERLRKVQQVIRDREAQSEEVYRKREAEKEQKLEEDRRLVLRATHEIELEKQAVQAKREQTKQAQMALVREVGQDQEKRSEARQRRIQEEKRALQEYAELLDKQEARSKATKPKIRDQLPAAPPRVKRKGEELYYDQDIVMRIHNEALAREEQADLDKQAHLKMERRKNQDFLFQQIAERDQQKKLIREQKSSLKAAAQAAAEEHRAAETHQLNERRKKYLQYRLDLEGQMRAKQVPQQAREDQMSGAEKAINRKYVMEALQKTSE
ncbi:unnamed protein product, partial [Symbiodinium pilosum]